MKRFSFFHLDKRGGILGAGIGAAIMGISTLCFSWEIGTPFAAFFLLAGLMKIKPKRQGTCFLLNGAWGSICILLSCIIPSIMVVDKSFFTLGHYRVAMNFACVAMAYGFCLIISGEIKSAVCLASTLLLIMSTANAFVYQFRGNELKILDFLSVRTALNVAGQYTFHISERMFLGWLIWMFMLFVLYRLPPSAPGSPRWKMRVMSVVATSVCAAAVLRGAPKVPIKNWNNEGTAINGYFLNFFIGIQESKIQKPAGYSPETVADLVPDSAPEETATSRNAYPNILVIMNESFADFRTLGSNFYPSQPVTPVLDSLEENTIRGYTLVSVFGGNTANSEFEFLTGSSMANLPRNSVPYQQYISQNVYSLPWLMNVYGYQCIASHPYISSGWNRTAVYPRFGFSEYTFIDDYPKQDLIRGYISDREMYGYVLTVLKESKKKPLFFFGITMQNHGGYESDGENFSRSISLEGYDMEYPMAERYLTLLHTSDQAIEYLLTELKAFPEDTVVLFFGDHFPHVEDEFMETVHGGGFDMLSDQMERYTIPFFIWANFDIPEQTVECTSLNYLGRYLLETVGLELPPYYQFLKELEQAVPAVNALGYYSISQQTFLPLEDAQGEEAKWLNDYAMVQYNNLFDQKNRNPLFFQNYLP